MRRHESALVPRRDDARIDEGADAEDEPDHREPEEMAAPMLDIERIAAPDHEITREQAEWQDEEQELLDQRAQRQA